MLFVAVLWCLIYSLIYSRCSIFTLVIHIFVHLLHLDVVCFETSFCHLALAYLELIRQLKMIPNSQSSCFSLSKLELQILQDYDTSTPARLFFVMNRWTESHLSYTESCLSLFFFKKKENMNIIFLSSNFYQLLFYFLLSKFSILQYLLLNSYFLLQLHTELGETWSTWKNKHLFKAIFSSNEILAHLLIVYMSGNIVFIVQ